MFQVFQWLKQAFFRWKDANNIQGYILNQERFEFQSKQELVSLLERCRYRADKKSIITVYLINANGDTCLWLLETLARVDPSGIIGSARYHLKFDSCYLHELFFFFFRNRLPYGQFQKLSFNESCQFATVTGDTNAEEAMTLSFLMFKEITLEVTELGYTDEIWFHLSVRMHARWIEGESEMLSNYLDSKPELKNDENRGFCRARKRYLYQQEIIPFAVLRKCEEGSLPAYDIADCQFLFCLLKLPNLKQATMPVASGTLQDFVGRAFDEFSERPSYCLPCDYGIGDQLYDPAYAMRVLDKFNATKIERMEIKIREETEEQMYDIMTRALEVLPQATQLQGLFLWCSKDWHYEYFIYMYREMCYLAHKFETRFSIGHGWIASETSNARRTGRRTLHRPNNSRNYKDDQRVLDQLVKCLVFRTSGTEWRTLVLLASATTLGSERMGSSCFVSMLCGNLLRHLQPFLY